MRRLFLRPFLLLYACSGAAALVYEVTWTRLLTLQMGHTVAAASTVLAAFMGGLAVGAVIAGRIPALTPSARLCAYALLEIAIALAAILLPALLALFLPALRWAYADGTTPFTLALVRIAITLALLGLPAAAMGATFPLAASWFAGKDAASDAGALYAANTAGAALGALGAGFWLIPAIGIRGTTWAGVALNACAAGGALWLVSLVSLVSPARDDQLEPTAGDAPVKKKVLRTPQRSRLPTPAEPRLAWAAAAISGFAALVYEVGWTRLLALVIGPTTYAFATMAASFISGLAIGSALGSELARRSTEPVRWLAAALAVTAAGASAAAWFTASRLPLIVAAQVASPGAAFGPIVLRQAFTVAMLLLPMTCALGAAFPLALAVASPVRSTIGRDAARVYAFNTLGAVTGALGGGFVLLPWLGLQNTFRASAMLGVVAGIGLWLASVGGARRSRAAGGVLGLATAAGAVFGLPSWDRDLMASGAYKYAPYMRAGDLETTLRAGRLVYYREGAASTVSVRRLAGTLSLAIDGKIDASNGGDMLTERLLGLLPVLLHRHAQDICIIGLGSGVTVGSALAPGTAQRVDVIEISPEVVEASAFFERENGHALSRRGVRVIVGDGRSHLLLTRRRYDIIVSEPSNPWMAGVAALFTREFFEAARAKLKPDGLLCQWAHTYDISAEDLRSIVRTFASVFPQGTMWLVGGGDLLLVGTTGAAIEPGLSSIVDRWRLGSVPAALADVAIDPAAAPFVLLSLYAGGPQELERYGDAAPVQSDDRMALEFSAPRGIYGRSGDENATAIRALAAVASRPRAVQAVFEAATDANWAARGAMELKAEAFGTAYDDFHRAVTLNARNVIALVGLSEAAAGARRQHEEHAWLESLAAGQPSNAAVRIELSRLRASSGDFKGAVDAATEAMRSAPEDPQAAEQLASVFADAGDADHLGPLADALVARFPERDEPRYYHATALFLKGQSGPAADEARRIVAANPRHARAQNLLGAACATAGQRDCARAAFEASLQANPHDPSTYVNLGVFHLQSADPATASAYFAEALTLDPTSSAARDGLVQSRAALAKP